MLEWNWDRKRATFHDHKAPKAISRLNSWFAVRQGDLVRRDSSDAYSNRTCGFDAEYRLLTEKGVVGTVTASGYSDYPEAVTCKYELDLRVAPKTPFLAKLLKQAPSVIEESDGLRLYHAGTSEDGIATFFIGPSMEALERLKEKGESPTFPTKPF